MNLELQFLNYFLNIWTLNSILHTIYIIHMLVYGKTKRIPSFLETPTATALKSVCPLIVNRLQNRWKPNRFFHVWILSSSAFSKLPKRLSHNLPFDVRKSCRKIGAFEKPAFLWITANSLWLYFLDELESFQKLYSHYSANKFTRLLFSAGSRLTMGFIIEIQVTNSNYNKLPRGQRSQGPSPTYDIFGFSSLIQFENDDVRFRQVDRL